MDAFIKSFSEFSKELTPILGAAALVCCIIVLVKLIKMFSGLNITVDKANKTIDIVDESLEKVQAPLDTVVKVSHTVDKVHDTTAQAIDAAKDFVVKSASKVAQKVTDYIEEDND